MAIKLTKTQTIKGNNITEEIFKKNHYIVPNFILNKITTYKLNKDS